MKFHPIHLLVAGLLALQTLSLSAEVSLDRIIAIVENDIIMQSEFEMQLRTVRSQMRKQDMEIPATDILEKQVLERMILTKIQLQQAEDTGIRVDDETLNRTINNIASGNKLSLSQFREILEEDGLSYERFREDIRDEIIVSRLRQRQVDNRILITNKEISNALSNLEFQEKTGTEYHLGHILVPLAEAPSPEDEEQTRQTALKILEGLKADQDFASVLGDQQTLKTSDLGWRKKDAIPTIFSAEISQMERGDISDLIQSPSGFHIIKIIDIRGDEKHIITQTNARHILIITDELTTEEDAKIRLEQLKTRLDSGDDFNKLAKAHSNDKVSAADGGSLGWSNPGQLVPQFEEVMSQLDIDEISEPFKTQFGWHILQVLERRKHDNTKNARRIQVSKKIRRRKSEEAHQNWLMHLRDEAYVEYRLDASKH